MPDWKADHVRDAIANPFHCLLGTIPDEQWIKAAARAIKEDGAEAFLGRLLFHIRNETGRMPKRR